MMAWAICQPALAQAPKVLKAKPGVAVAVLNLVNARSDCSTLPNPMPLPVLKQKPADGTIFLQIGVANIPANNNCPARKIPMIVLGYISKKDFTGTDAVEIEVDSGNRATLLSYHITVTPDAQAQPL